MGLIVAAKTVITVALAEAPSLSHFVIYAQSLPLAPAIHAPSLHLVTVIPAPNLPQGCKECISAVGKMPEKQQKA